MSLKNIWHLRKVADTSSKPCYICYKPTTSVLITPDNKDFFYVCLGHLKDRNFCSPIVDDAEVAAKKKKEDLDREIELIKREYEEKLKKRKAKDGKAKAKDSDKDKDKEKEADEDEDKKAEEEKDEKIKAIASKDQVPAVNDTPRILSLHKNFYQMRLDRIRNAEIAKRNRDRLKNPTTFPSAPAGDL